MTQTTAKLLAALALAGVAAGAQASVSANASIGALSVQVIDINPLDGITPTLSFSDGLVWSSINASSYWDHQSNDLATGSSSAYNATNGSLSVIANSNGLSSSANIVSGTYAFYYTNQRAQTNLNFSLDGAAAVIFSTPFSVSATNNNGYDYGYSWAELSGYAYSDSGSKNTSFSDSQGAGVAEYYSNHSYSKQGTLTGGFVSTASSTYGTIYLHAGSDVQTQPVPEPSEYLMLLAGLGVVGYAAKRRQTR